MKHLDVRQGEGNRGEGRLHEPCVLAPARGVPGDLPVAEVDEKAGVVPLGADPHAGGIRDDARPRCAPAELAGDYVGELGLAGPAGMGFEPGPGVCADGAVPPMMRPMRRLEAQNPRRSGAAFTLRAPQARQSAPWAGTASGASGSGRFGFSACPRMLQQAGLDAPGIPCCAGIG